MMHFFIFYPNHIFRIGKSRHFKFRVLIDAQEYWCMHNISSPKRMCSESRAAIQRPECVNFGIHFDFWLHVKRIYHIFHRPSYFCRMYWIGFCNDWCSFSISLTTFGTLNELRGAWAIFFVAPFYRATLRRVPKNYQELTLWKSTKNKALNHKEALAVTLTNLLFRFVSFFIQRRISSICLSCCQIHQHRPASAAAADAVVCLTHFFPVSKIATL